MKKTRKANSLRRGRFAPGCLGRWTQSVGRQWPWFPKTVTRRQRIWRTTSNAGSPTSLSQPARETFGTRLARWERHHRSWFREGAAALVLVSVISVSAALVVNQARRQADERRIEVQEVTARTMLNRGLSLCDQGETARGMLWLARSLEYAPSGSASLERLIRSNLAAWRSELCTLVELREFPGDQTADTLSKDGRTVLLSNAETASVWDVASGSQIGEPMTLQASTISTIALSRDGGTVLTAGTYAQALECGYQSADR